MDYTHLQPPAQAYSIKHDDHYVMHYRDGRPIRNVFENVPYDKFEEESISKVEELLKKKNIQLPPNWRRDQTLKYCYSGVFDTQVCVQNILNHLLWKQNQDYQILNQRSEEQLKKGVIYTLGRDKHCRPLIFIQTSLISTDINQLSPTLTALCVLLNQVKQYMLVPYHVEKWRIIIDLTNLNLFKIPVQIIKSIIDVTQSNYTASLEQIHIYNPPFFLAAVWKLIEKLMHPETAAKIQFCTNPLDLQQHIDADQLQTQYKGTFPQQTTFWPIINTYKHLNDSCYISLQPQSEYYTVNSDSQILSPPIAKTNNCCAECSVM